jgi:hypothetical protein
MQLRVTLCLAALIFLSACGSSSHSGTSSSSSSSGSITGNWQMNLQPSDSKTNPRPQSGFLVQNNNLVTGSMIYVANPCTGVGNVQGTVTGTTISIVVSPTGTQVNLTGTVGAGQTTMNGTYTTLSMGCSGTNVAPATGTWIATLISPLSGNFSGTLTSANNTVYQVTGQLTQGPNIGTSNASLTGSVSVTGYCFSTANISGVVSGTSAVISLVTSAGAQIGQMNLTSSIDGTSLTGSYNLLPQPEPPCGDGASGTVSLAVSNS